MRNSSEFNNNSANSDRSCRREKVGGSILADLVTQLGMWWDVRPGNAFSRKKLKNKSGRLIHATEWVYGVPLVPVLNVLFCTSYLFIYLFFEIHAHWSTGHWEMPVMCQSTVTWLSWFRQKE